MLTYGHIPPMQREKYINNGKIITQGINPQ
jgi:hypothetical protein